MEKIKFPLYHATSSLFKDSIKEFGLGGFNPILEFKVIELMKELEIIANNSLKNINSWIKLQYSTSLMTQQKITTYGGSFQHGDVYLTPSLYTASHYSKNRYGSEAITQTFEIIDLLEVKGVSISKELMQIYNSFFELRKLPCEPIVYRMKNLPIIYLSQGERGEDLEQQIKEVEEAISEYGLEKYEGIVQQVNFRVKKPIPWEIVNS